MPLTRRGPLTLQPRLRTGISRITTDVVRGRQEATVCKGNGRESGCEGEEDRRLKNGSSVNVYFGCSGMCDFVVRRYGGNMMG